MRPPGRTQDLSNPFTHSTGDTPPMWGHRLQGDGVMLPPPSTHRSYDGSALIPTNPSSVLSLCLAGGSQQLSRKRCKHRDPTHTSVRTSILTYYKENMLRLSRQNKQRLLSFNFYSIPFTRQREANDSVREVHESGWTERLPHTPTRACGCDLK